MSHLFNTVRLADGTELEGSCGLAGKAVWCWISNLPMADCFTIFTDSEKTKEFSTFYINKGIRYKGFTEMELIKRGTDAFGNETIDIKLTWPDGGEHSVEEFPIVQQTEEGGQGDAEVS